VHSVLDRTPAQLLHEIILVDDDSDFDDLKGELEEYVQKYLPGKIKVIRNPKREGLIRGRMIGAAHATGITSAALLSGCWQQGLCPWSFLIVPRSVKSDRRLVHFGKGFFITPPRLSQNRLQGREL